MARAAHTMMLIYMLSSVWVFLCVCTWRLWQQQPASLTCYSSIGKEFRQDTILESCTFDPLFGWHDCFVVSVAGNVLPPSSSFILYNGRYSGIQERRSRLVVYDMIMDETTVASLKSFDWLVSSSIYFVAISTVLLLFDWIPIPS